MPKKKLNSLDITNELQHSAFFPDHKPEFKEEQKIESHSPIEPQRVEKPVENKPSDTMVPRHHDTTVSRNQESKVPTNEAEILEEVRKIVKQIGKEPATQRLTLQEKQEIADIEYTYKRQGIKTSGNEIIRIATNYIVKDYKNNGEGSILAKVLKKLNS